MVLDQPNPFPLTIRVAREGTRATSEESTSLRAGDRGRNGIAKSRAFSPRPPC
jgi:hypothetical protein